MIETRSPKTDEELILAEIRARAMKESLLTAGRFDEVRVRSRFLESYDPKSTTVLTLNGEVVGFYVTLENLNHISLSHLYVDDGCRGRGIGQIVIDSIKELAIQTQKEIRLNTLVASSANRFYVRNGFVLASSDGIDNFYVWTPSHELVLSKDLTIKLVFNSIRACVYSELRKAVGWTTYSDEDINLGLSKSLFCVVAYEKDSPIGMGRVIGDGKMVFYIQDIIVLHQYQGLGVGSHIMKRIMDFINQRTVNNSIVGLMSAVGKEGFYEKFGFLKRPNDKMGFGMNIWVKKEGAS